MNLKTLTRFAETSPDQLSPEEKGEYFDAMRKTTEGLLRNQLTPKVRAPYQLESLEQSTFKAGRILLSWKDIQATRTGVGQKFTINVPKDVVMAKEGNGVALQFNDQLGERPELAQATGRARNPQALSKGGRNNDEIRKEYIALSKSPAGQGVAFGQGKVSSTVEKEDGTYDLEIEVTARNPEKLNWHLQKNYGSQLSSIIEMAPLIVERLKAEATDFVQKNSGLLNMPATLLEGLETYAVASFALPEKLMANFGRSHNIPALNEEEEMLAAKLSGGINNFAKQYPQPGIAEKSATMIHGVSSVDEPMESELETSAKRIDGIRNFKGLDTIVGPKGAQLCAEIFLNHLEDDTRLAVASPQTLLLPTLGLPGDVEGEENDRETTLNEFQSFKEDQEHNGGEENALDSNEAQTEKLLATEKGRMRVIPLPTSARAINGLREYPGNPRNGQIRKIMAVTLAGAEKSAPPQDIELVKNLKDLFRPGTPAEKMGELESICNTLGKRLAANWYSGNPADIMLRMLVKKPNDQDLALIKNKGGVNIAANFLKFTSRHSPKQNPLHPVSSKLVTYAMFGIKPQGEIPREVLADFSARLTHARIFQRVMFKPSEIILDNEATQAVDTLSKAFNAKEQGKDVPVEQAQKAVGQVILGAFNALSFNSEPQTSDIEVTQLGKRLGINLPAAYKGRGEENTTSRGFLARLAGETIEGKSSDLSTAIRKVNDAFAPFEKLESTRTPETVVVHVKLDQLQNIESRIDGASDFGDLANFNSGKVRAVTSDALLPAVWAEKNGIPYKVEIEQVDREKLTVAEWSTIEHLIIKAVAATKDELGSENVRGSELRNQEVALSIGKTIEDAKELLAQLDAPKQKPKVITDAIAELRGTQSIEGLIPMLQAEAGKELPKESAVEAFQKFKTSLESGIQQEKDSLEDSLPEIAKVLEESRKIEAFLSDYRAPKTPASISTLPNGELTGNRLWIKETTEIQSLDTGRFQTLVDELIDNPPSRQDVLVLQVVGALKDGLITDTSDVENKKETTPLSFRMEEGVIEKSLLNAYTRAYGHTGAVRNYATTAPEITRRNSRYQESEKSAPQKDNSPGLI